eukprot:TRINITY_DN11131_c0_g6_i1.p1 TRINITY_DN11131_c0_g6~~TRINITY_DN11131_c0_g6_i1.p1  ORF type:complete len:559 (+),score=202.12 TRINITY_DN11131_c0_g6_i1:349-2025(+)
MPTHCALEVGVAPCAALGRERRWVFLRPAPKRAQAATTRQNLTNQPSLQALFNSAARRERGALCRKTAKRRPEETRSRAAASTSATAKATARDASAGGGVRQRTARTAFETNPKMKGRNQAMRGKASIGVLLALGMLLVAPAASLAAEATQEAILQKLDALQKRVTYLEDRLAEARDAAQTAQKAAAEAYATSGRSLKMSQEIAKTKDRQPEGLLTEAGKRLKLYGAVELEGSYNNYEPSQGEGTTESDFTIATAEIFFDATINKYTKGLIHLLYEGEGSAINVDEAFILVGQTEDMPFYFLGGLMYPAIGLFETYMVSDPITQNVFETQATAGEIGWAQDWFNVGAGVFNSSVHQASDAPDRNINTLYVRAQFDAPEGAFGEGVDLNFGAAYTNNIAGGNLGDEVVGEQLQDMVGGLSLMLNAQYKWAVFNAEYITALDDFQAGELSFASGKAKPYAYNLELAFLCIEDWAFAVRYEGGGDLGDFEPERQYGLTVAWDFLPDTTISLELLRGDYANDDERTLVTTQLAVAFQVPLPPADGRSRHKPGSGRRLPEPRV